jgi:YVTN family beta-propeller protein
MRHLHISLLLAANLLTSVAFAGEGDYLICVTNERSGDISVIAGRTAEVIATIPVGKRPRGVQVSHDEKQLYVALSGSPISGPPAAGTRDRKSDDEPPPDRSADGIGVVDLKERKLLRVLPSGLDPEQFALNREGTALYISNEETAMVSVLDLASGKIRGTIKVKEEPEGVKLSPDGRRVYVTCETAGDIFVIDTARDEAIAHFIIPGRPRTVAFLPDGSRAFIPAETLGTITAVDTIDHHIVKTTQLPEGSRPMGTLVSSDGSRLYVSAGRAQKVFAINTTTLEVEASVQVGTRPWGLAFSPDEKLLYVANGPSNDVSVVELTQLKEVRRIKVGASPWGIAIVPTP